MSEEIYLTQEGYNALKDKFKYLVNVRRPIVLQQLVESREKGDLSENAEYDAVREEQSKLEAEIFKMEQTLRNAIVVEKAKDIQSVCLLSTVTLRMKTTGLEMKYTLVSEEEASIPQKRVSIQSPLGKELLGKKVGDIITIKTTNGAIEYEIISIE